MNQIPYVPKITGNNRIDRTAFWGYCQRAAKAAQVRAAAKNVPHAIDAHFIDGLLVDQKWRCAISHIPLNAPTGARDPFGPSLDRIVPSVGYVPGNVRIVCNIVNSALNEWGFENLMVMLRAVGELYD